MRIEEFEKWLKKQNLTKNAIKDCLCRCKRVEKALPIDLDDEYKKDKGESVLTLLTYTPEDTRNGKPVPGNFDFKPGTNICFRFRDLKVSTKKYFVFCRESNNND